jgi:hypothetical protein
MYKRIKREEVTRGHIHYLTNDPCTLPQTINKQTKIKQDPWVAIVVDPKRTVAAGKVELGAFRTYPEVRYSLLISFSMRV